MKRYVCCGVSRKATCLRSMSVLIANAVAVRAAIFLAVVFCLRRCCWGLPSSVGTRASRGKVFQCAWWIVEQRVEQCGDGDARQKKDECLLTTGNDINTATARSRRSTTLKSAFSARGRMSPNLTKTIDFWLFGTPSTTLSPIVCHFGSYQSTTPLHLHFSSCSCAVSIFTPVLAASIFTLAVTILLQNITPVAMSWPLDHRRPRMDPHQPPLAQHPMPAS